MILPIKESVLYQWKNQETLGRENKIR